MESRSCSVLKVCLVCCSMCIGVPFIAPRGLGIIEVPFGRPWFPSVCGCTELFGGAPYSSCATTTKTSKWPPSFFKWAPDYPVAHRTCSVALPTIVLLTWPTQIALLNIGVGEESLAVWRTGYVWCTPSGILNQRALVFSCERPVGQLTRSGTGLSNEAQSSPILSTFEPNFLTPFWLDLNSSLTLR
jgi:hypothetical protein